MFNAFQYWMKYKCIYECLYWCITFIVCSFDDVTEEENESWKKVQSHCNGNWALNCKIICNNNNDLF